MGLGGQSVVLGIGGAEEVRQEAETPLQRIFLEVEWLGSLWRGGILVCVCGRVCARALYLNKGATRMEISHQKLGV